jgi:ABC-type nitrate/sulfonate/bicarbonate transport system substrate-binding protein
MIRQLRRLRFTVLVLVLSLVVYACGDEGASDDTAENNPTATQPEAGDGGAPTTLQVLFPINSPILHGYRVAEQAGYYEEEGIDVQFEFLDGGGEVVTQLLAGNGDIGNIPVGPVVEAIEEGHTDLRAIWNYVYGSIFYLGVPVDSDIQSAEDLAGHRIGISDLAGGEVPIMRGIVETAGLDPESDVEFVPIGAGTALSLRALQDGEVDAFGGSVNDMIALEVQGMELRYIQPDVLLELPASGLVVNEATLSEQREAVEGFLRASTKGFYWGQVEPEATLCVLREATPEQFTDETGELILEAVLPITWAPEGELMGHQSADTWLTFFEFIGADLPDVELEEIVIDDLLEAANDFDRDAVEEDANSHADC